jgi:hypothetical protein
MNIRGHIHRLADKYKVPHFIPGPTVGPTWAHVSDPCPDPAPVIFIGDVFVGGQKMHIFTANIPIFHSRYIRFVLITNRFHVFC